MSKLLIPVTHPRQQYYYLTTLLWENIYCKSAFTKNRTERTDIHQFYWYTLDHGSQERVQRLYYCIPDGIFIDYNSVLYKISEMSQYTQSNDTMLILKLEDIDNSINTISYIGRPVPAKSTVKQATIPQKGREQHTDAGTYAAIRRRR